MLIVLEYTTNETRQHASAIVYSSQALSGTLGNLGGGLLPKLIVAPFSGADDGIGRVVPRHTDGRRGDRGAGARSRSLRMRPLPASGAARWRASGGRCPSRRRRRRARGEADFYVFIISGGLLAVASGAVIPFYNVFLTRLGASTQVVGYIYAAAALVAAVVGLLGRSSPREVRRAQDGRGAAHLAACRSLSR